MFLGVYSSIACRPKGNQIKTAQLKDIDGTDDDVGGDEDEGWDGIIRRAVIGVPANCSEKKKEATKRAARSAGLEEVRRGAPFCSVQVFTHACSQPASPEIVATSLDKIENGSSSTFRTYAMIVE